MSTTKFFAARTRLAALVFLCALGAWCFSGCSNSSMSQGNSNAIAGNQSVATVNGKTIPLNIFEMYLKNGRAALELDPDSEAGKRKLDQLREGIVSELIDRALIREEAERRSLAIAPDAFAEAERKTIADLGGDQRYNSYLAEHGFTSDEYREVIKSELYADLVRKELNKGLAVAPEAVKKFYEENRNSAEFKHPERVTAAHILIAARPNLISQKLQDEKSLTGNALMAAVREELKRLHQRAEGLRRQASAGADFAKLAREFSEDAGTRDRGGDLGTFPRGSHARAFDEAAFTIKPGQVGQVVRSEFGFHVIKVMQHDTARSQTLEEATPEITRRLLGKFEAQKLTEWLREARRKATVRINEPYRFGSLKTEFP